jgi:hypothetical protein
VTEIPPVLGTCKKKIRRAVFDVCKFVLSRALDRFDLPQMWLSMSKIKSQTKAAKDGLWLLANGLSGFWEVSGHLDFLGWGLGWIGQAFARADDGFVLKMF